MGAFAGWVEARQLISRQDPSDARTGGIGGLFVDVATQAPWLDVMAEVAVVQRGGSVHLDDVVAEVEVDYLTFALLGKARFGVGPVQAFGYGGPVLDYHLRTRAGGELAVVYRQPAAQVLAVALGGGLEVPLGTAGSLRLELRHDEGLTGAFPDAPQDVRHRSRTLVLRYGRRAPG